MPLVSLAVALLPGILSETRSVNAGLTTAANRFVIVLLVFDLGWYGVERVFFQRHLQQNPAAWPHFLRLVPRFIGRFLVIGVLVGLMLFTFTFGMLRIADPDIMHRADAAATLPIWTDVAFAALVILIDFALTFIPPALAYTTRSAGHAVKIGITMIAQTWPRSALYVVCPPLALTVLNYAFPVGGLGLRLLITSVLALVSLLAKGAIAAFYLRERGSYGDDGAAYIPREVSEPGPRWPLTLMLWIVSAALAMTALYLLYDLASHAQRH